jgi:VIT1/CCC1 family predicted Fe2+/Mn2+ transporter
MRHSDAEHHYMQRIGWLRAAVLGANDGIVSNASLVLGIAASGATTHNVVLAGVAGLVAGSMSMAAGEYVSVSSQSDTESSDRERERVELEINPAVELEELVQIYMQRGLDRPLAEQVATQLTAKDALGAHLRDELGLHDARQAQPVQAALTSAVTFAGGAVLPLLILAACPREYLSALIPAGALAALGLIGAVSARTGGSKITVATARIMFWGAFAMALTYAAGRLFGAVAG